MATTTNNSNSDTDTGTPLEADDELEFLSSPEMVEARAKYIKRKSNPTEEQDKSKNPRVEDDLICPITHELPWNPVMAKDGRIYEKFAIEKHFETDTKSPYTGENIGTQLVPSPQIKNLIDTLVANGTIIGELSENWTRKRNEEQEMKNLLQNAENGDKDSMIELGRCYEVGTEVLKQNQTEAFKWYHAAHNAGSATGTAYVGELFVLGKGTEKNIELGLVFLGEAAGKGEAYACHQLGMMFADGVGVKKNREEAIRWLRSCIGENTDDSLSDFAVKVSETKLKELLVFKVRWGCRGLRIQTQRTIGV